MSNSWKERQLRARQWLAKEPPAEQMLELYLELLAIQESLYHEALASGSYGDVLSSDGTPPLIRAERLDVSSLLPGFQPFLRKLIPEATDVLKEIARSLEGSDHAVRTRLLETFLRREPLDDLAVELSCDAIQLEFFPRAYLQPILEAIRSKGAKAPDGWRESTCPQCGWPPVVGVLRDEPEIKGRRLLECSLCANQWTFRRSMCVQCGETDPEKLAYHVSDAMPHIRVDECQTCRGYLKTVDLRKDGRAVPVVEDLASVELDLWCDERGLWKIQRNLLGF